MTRLWDLIYISAKIYQNISKHVRIMALKQYPKTASRGNNYKMNKMIVLIFASNTPTHPYEIFVIKISQRNRGYGARKRLIAFGRGIKRKR